MRLYINRLTLNGVKNYREYELKRFEVKDRTDQVIVEVQCPICSDYQYSSVEAIYFLSCYFDKSNKQIQNLYINLKCNHGKLHFNCVSMNLTNFLAAYFDPDLML